MLATTIRHSNLYKRKCKNYRQVFSSSNQLFCYLKSCTKDLAPAKLVTSIQNLSSIKGVSYNIRKKALNAPLLSISTRIGYRGFIYAIAKVRLLKDTTTKTIYFNIGYLVSLINKDFLLKQALDIKIYTIATLVTVSGLSSSKHVTNKYIIYNICILGINNKLEAKD